MAPELDFASGGCRVYTRHLSRFSRLSGVGYGCENILVPTYVEPNMSRIRPDGGFNTDQNGHNMAK